ncbi:MAG: Ig-like domain-containing protein [Actinomycetota bacterium]
MISLLVAMTAGIVTATSAMAADGQQTAPSLAPSPVPTAADTFTLGNGTCDGTGGDGWRVQTFIVDGDVDLSTLVFDQGPFSDRVGTDRDSSDSTIRSPLWKGSAPGTGYNPAASPAGLINPSDLSAFDFSNAGWVLTDGEYQIGYACLDELSALRQWWSLTVTIDADASPNPFLVISEPEPEPESTSIAVTADPASSTVGDEVTFTAAVTPAGAAGSVEFSLGGSPQATAVVSAGSATWTTSALTVGTKSITATFTPSDAAAFSGSTSPTLSYVVSGAGAQETAVSLASDPAGQAAVGEEVTFTATVEPAAPGTVTFSEGGEVLGGPVDVTDGVATYATSSLAEGTHSVVATFTPTDVEAFQPSSSSALSLTVGAGTPTPVPSTVGSTDVLGSSTGAGIGTGGSSLPRTGGGVGVAGLGLVLIYAGRVLYLLGRPLVPTARR